MTKNHRDRLAQFSCSKRRKKIFYLCYQLWNFKTKISLLSLACQRGPIEWVETFQFLIVDNHSNCKNILFIRLGLKSFLIRVRRKDYKSIATTIFSVSKRTKIRLERSCNSDSQYQYALSTCKIQSSSSKN